MLVDAGADGAADAADANAECRPLDGVDTGQYRSRTAHFTPSHANDRVAFVAAELEPENRELQIGAPGVSNEVLRREPHLPLEDAPVEFRALVAPELDCEVAPARLQVLREVFHESVSASESLTGASTASAPVARSATSTPTCS